MPAKKGDEIVPDNPQATGSDAAEVDGGFSTEHQTVPAKAAPGVDSAQVDGQAHHTNGMVLPAALLNSGMSVLILPQLTKLTVIQYKTRG